ncbi:NAD(P)-dependent oxidoreductase [Aquabacterium sp. A7-Y]|uniref:NAD(P)-dependent oxidoreductase n=1 Tax=Aquabacterium sp. A7-Y TaxID=1349605 RepID=UPI00223E75CC|nr:NAD(P)-dependent oxidoreductase [Aquabacterium sp. A7-Y]MCW7537671.1 NAD(P)-dependent oxidoreductase [Aquabacterium sp. A7-Y]
MTDFHRNRASTMNLTVLGIGLMGMPMAKRLREAGFEVTAWNRTREKALRLASHGARVAHTAAQAVRDADIVITMLDNGEVVDSVLFGQGVASVLKPGTLVIDMSSIKPSQARQHAARLRELGMAHLDAPVSGGTVGAEAGTLAIMAGGEAADFERALPVFAPLGRATHVGPHGAGQLAKLANQMIVGITIGAVSEALLLCAKGGADMAKVREAIRGGFAESRVLDLHGQRMVENDFVKRAALTVQLKDMRNALDTASELGFEAPVTGLFEQLYASATEHGFAELDHSALFCELARRNGMR